jgi:hypothetical protein
MEKEKRIDAKSGEGASVYVIRFSGDWTKECVAASHAQ